MTIIDGNAPAMGDEQETTHAAWFLYWWREGDTKCVRWGPCGTRAEADRMLERDAKGRPGFQRAVMVERTVTTTSRVTQRIEVGG